MKEINGQVVAWNPETGRGSIHGDDGKRYPFTTKEWADPDHGPWPQSAAYTDFKQLAEELSQRVQSRANGIM